jgi:cation diffusion facilitator family transporter
VSTVATTAIDPQNANREKRGAALSSVVAAVFLTGMKLVVGILTGSLGILSEAAHSGLDLVAAAVTFFAVRMSGRPPDTRHTYGYGKVENLSALFETVLLLVTCGWIIYEAIERLFFRPVPVEPSIVAFVVMAVSIIVDVSRSRMLYRVAKKHHSQALEADALHFSTDIWSSAVVLVGLFLVFLSHRLGVEWLEKADAVAAVGVAGIVITISARLGKRTIMDLLDAIPPGLRDEVIHVVQHVPGVVEVTRARIRRSGPGFFADVSLAVGRETAFEAAHEVARQAEAAVRTVLVGNDDVVVNVAPVASNDEGVLTTVRLLAARRGLGVHGIHIYDVLGERSLEFHVEVDDSLTVAEAHDQATAFEEALRDKLPDITRIVTHIEPTGERAATKAARPVDEKFLLDAIMALPAEYGVRCEPHDVVINRVGGQLAVSFHCSLDGALSIGDAHALTETLESALRARVPYLGRIVIHVEPPEAATERS